MPIAEANLLLFSDIRKSVQYFAYIFAFSFNSTAKTHNTFIFH